MVERDGKILKTFWIDKEEYEKFKSICDKYDIVPSKFYRRGIKEIINKYTVYRNDYKKENNNDEKD